MEPQNGTDGELYCLPAGWPAAAHLLLSPASTTTPVFGGSCEARMKGLCREAVCVFIINVGMVLGKAVSLMILSSLLILLRGHLGLRKGRGSRVVPQRGGGSWALG